MSRQRTTWNAEEIRTAAMNKQADPYLMNQDHVSQNPRADKYMNGTPSSWAEDVHTPNEWEKEYSGGTTKRNEIGEAAFRPETFNHQEHAKAASSGYLIKKADLAVKVARLILPKASEGTIEDQAVSLMSLSDSELIDTHNRLANDGQDQGQTQQAPADQQQQAAVQTTAQAQDEQTQSQGQQQQQQATQQQDETQQAPAQQQQQAGQQQTAMQQCMEALQQGDQQKAMTAVKQMVQEAMKQQQSSQADFPGGEWGHNNPVTPVAASTKTVKRAQGQDQGQAQQEPAQQQQQAGLQDQQAAMQQQIQSMVQQAVQEQMQQWQGQQQAPEQGGQQVQANDDMLLDDMLAPATAATEVAGLGDIQLEPSPMDVGEVQLGPEDAVLKTLFATQETQDAEQAQGQQQQHQAAVVRSPATRTVGTRPTAGVSRVGGAGAVAPQTKTASDVDKLAGLWNSAPDVREHFGIR